MLSNFLIYSYNTIILPLVIKTKGQLLHLTKTILHIYINRLAVG